MPNLLCFSNTKGPHFIYLSVFFRAYYLFLKKQVFVEMPERGFLLRLYATHTPLSHKRLCSSFPQQPAVCPRFRPSLHRPMISLSSLGLKLFALIFSMLTYVIPPSKWSRHPEEQGQHVTPSCRVKRLNQTSRSYVCPQRQGLLRAFSGTLPHFHTGAPNPVNKITCPDHHAPLQRGEVMENIQYWGKRVSGESTQQRLICVDSPVELWHVLVEILV